jgi:eukaryotic-like serine/threonine-protein kinase
MNPERLNRIEEIFHAALEVQPDDRRSFLDDKCGSDERLRKEVESLLEFDEASGQLLDQTPGAIAAEMFANEEEPKDRIGSTIGRYRIASLLGTGGMGEVYLAEDTQLGRRVALKILPEVYARDKDRMARFGLEARTASALNHPNIITIHEIGEADGVRFITAEYIDGPTLKKLISSGRLPIYSAIEIAIQIASALEEAHSAGIVHRDIKPDNIMVRPSGLVKVLDFGVAKLLEPVPGHGKPIADRLESGASIPGMIVGTADYMSPEQARGGFVDQRSDIFSFGVVLYEMLAGSKAFTGENAADTIGAILHKEPPRMTESGVDVPPSIDVIVRKCLAKPVGERYANVGELLSDLRQEKRRIELIDNGIETARIEPNESGQPIAAAADPIEHSTQRGRPLHSDASIPAARTAREFSINGRTGGRKARKFAAAGLVLTVMAALSGLVGYPYLVVPKKIESIAVMPFVNASRDTGVEYLSDGMTENLIRSLSIISGLSIKARSTVFTYKGKETTPNAIGEELGVDAVLLGRLEQRGDDLNLSLELVDTATQDVLWTSNYSRKLSDLSALQREIARDVSRRLRPELTASEQKRISKNYSSNSEAQQLYLKGRFHWNKRSSRDFEKAVQYFDQAVQKDPNYALAYTGAADTYALMPLYGTLRPTEYIPKAKQAAQKALELDENLAEAHASLGYITTTYDFDWETAEEHYKRAILLNPNYATAHQWYAEHLAFKGRTEEALSEISIALELDPFSLVINRMKGNILGFAKRQDEAIAQFNKTIELYQESPIVRFNLGEALAAKGMYAEAVEQYIVGFKLEGRKNHEIRRYQNAFKLKGWQGFWMEYLATLITLREAVIEADELAYYDYERLAYAFAATGNNEKAMEYLNKAYDVREPSLITIKTSEVYDFLKYDPAFKELIQKIGLPE